MTRFLICALLCLSATKAWSQGPVETEQQRLGRLRANLSAVEGDRALSWKRNEDAAKLSLKFDLESSLVQGRLVMLQAQLNEINAAVAEGTATDDQKAARPLLKAQLAAEKARLDSNRADSLTAVQFAAQERTKYAEVEARADQLWVSVNNAEQNNINRTMLIQQGAEIAELKTIMMMAKADIESLKGEVAKNYSTLRGDIDKVVADMNRGFVDLQSTIDLLKQVRTCCPKSRSATRINQYLIRRPCCPSGPPVAYGGMPMMGGGPSFMNGSGANVYAPSVNSGNTAVNYQPNVDVTQYVSPLYPRPVYTTPVTPCGFRRPY